MKKISIIVPVYNTSKFINQCIQSIVNQTYTCLEIILVDDGSTDTSGLICDECAKKDTRITVVHQKNSGVSSARNYGIDIATGDYIAFVDSDDFVEPTMYASLIKALEKNNLDIISCFSFRLKHNRISSNHDNELLEIWTQPEITINALLDIENNIWNKVYKKEMWSGVRFPVGQKFEDTAIAYKFFINAKRFGCLHQSYYYYRYNPTSITQTAFTVKDRWDFVLGYIERLDYAEKNNLPCINECKSLLLKASLSCLTTVYAHAQETDSENIYKQIEKLIYTHRSPDTYCLLSTKYKILLWSFGKMDFIHKFYAFLSNKQKQIKGFLLKHNL